MVGSERLGESPDRRQNIRQRFGFRTPLALAGLLWQGRNVRRVAYEAKGAMRGGLFNEYMPDERWKASGTCTDTYKGGDTVSESWEEGSHLKEYTYKITGGTGKYQGASGGGTYLYENLTDTLAGGRFKGQIVLP